MHISSWEVNINIDSAVTFPHLLLLPDADLMYYASNMVYMSITCDTWALYLHFRGLWKRLWLLRWTKRNLKSIKRRWPSALGLTSFKCIFNIVDFDLGAWNSKYTLLLNTCGQTDQLVLNVHMSFHFISFQIKNVRLVTSPHSMCTALKA